MQPLTEQGRVRITELAHRYGISVDTVMGLLEALVNGNGTMAQFYLPELGGGGQWMQGGMTMVGDMFNQSLKAKVDGLCNELAQLLAQKPFTAAPAHPSVSPSALRTGAADTGTQAAAPQKSSTTTGSSGNWYPSEFGPPNASGGQNNSRYAYFSNARRLAVDVNGTVTVYDTQNHRIGGVAQQQGNQGSLTLTSQFGNVDIASLPVISVNGAAPPSFVSQDPASPNGGLRSAEKTGSKPDMEADIIGKIERLAELQKKGFVSAEEFAAKKAELLKRL